MTQASATGLARSWMEAREHVLSQCCLLPTFSATFLAWLSCSGISYWKKAFRGTGERQAANRSFMAKSLLKSELGTTWVAGSCFLHLNSIQKDCWNFVKATKKLGRELDVSTLNHRLFEGYTSEGDFRQSSVCQKLTDIISKQSEIYSQTLLNLFALKRAWGCESCLLSSGGRSKKYKQNDNLHLTKKK